MAITGAYDNDGKGPDAREKSIEWGGGYPEGSLSWKDAAIAAGAAIGNILGNILADIGGLKGFANTRMGIYGALLGAGFTYAGTKYYKRGSAGTANMFLDAQFFELKTINGIQVYTLREAQFVDLGGKPGSKSAPGVINMQEGAGNDNFKIGWNGAALVGAIDRATGGQKRRWAANKIADQMIQIIYPDYPYSTAMDLKGVLANRYEDNIKEMRSFYDSKRGKYPGLLI